MPNISDALSPGEEKLCMGWISRNYPAHEYRAFWVEDGSLSFVAVNYDDPAADRPVIVSQESVVVPLKEASAPPPKVKKRAKKIKKVRK